MGSSKRVQLAVHPSLAGTRVVYFMYLWSMEAPWKTGRRIAFGSPAERRKMSSWLAGDQAQRIVWPRIVWP